MLVANRPCGWLIVVLGGLGDIGMTVKTREHSPAVKGSASRVAARGIIGVCAAPVTWPRIAKAEEAIAGYGGSFPRQSPGRVL